MYQIARTQGKTFSRIPRIAGNEFTYNVPQGQYVLPAIPRLLSENLSAWDLGYRVLVPQSVMGQFATVDLCYCSTVVRRLQFKVLPGVRGSQGGHGIIIYYHIIIK